MITLLSGENSFEIAHALKQIQTEFEGQAEFYEGAELNLGQLPDLLMGMSLFSQKRLVVIRRLSENSALWSVLPDWIDRISDDVHLVLVEPKPDKRTKTWKSLQKIASLQTYDVWQERDRAQAERWVEQQAATRQMKLLGGAARLLVERIGVDQWQLYHALEALQVYGEVTEDIIRSTIEPTPLENVFELFEAALSAKQTRVEQILRTLTLSEDPYRLFGLLSGQAFQLAVLSAAHAEDDVARELGVHPYALSKLRPHAKRLGVEGAGKMVSLFAEADVRMKTSAVTPWLVIEQTLLQVATAK